ncbi:ATP-binding protein [Streptomyces mutabilis]
MLRSSWCPPARSAGSWIRGGGGGKGFSAVAAGPGTRCSSASAAHRHGPRQRPVRRGRTTGPLRRREAPRYVRTCYREFRGLAEGGPARTEELVAEWPRTCVGPYTCRTKPYGGRTARLGTEVRPRQAACVTGRLLHEVAERVHRTTPRVLQFTVRLSSTGRGARLARRFAVQQLAARGVPYDSETSQAVVLVTAELAANAVTHGRTPGRDFRLTLLFLPEHTAVRVEVTDTRPERLPHVSAAEPAALDAPSGRGLLLVAEYAERWGWEVRDAYTKSVWAEVLWPA